MKLSQKTFLRWLLINTYRKYQQNYFLQSVITQKKQQLIIILPESIPLMNPIKERSDNSNNAIDIPIVDKGKGWVCVEKPGGISIHNEPGKDLISLLKKQIADTIRGRIIQPVHRLDKETSGLLLLALDQKTLARLSALFASGKVKKKYKALVHGNFDMSDPSQKSIWEFPLSKQAGGRSNPGGKGKKVTAHTRYTVIKQTPHYALLDITLLTGRKHQIRRHAKMSGHPIVGDTRYSSARAIAFLREKRGYTGMSLHSYFLEFNDNGQTATLELKTLPISMEKLLNEDR